MSSAALNPRQAIVMGGSIAGLLAARALSPHFDTVIVIEKDARPGGPEPRAGVPHGRHIHVLLPGGLAAIDRLFPGASDELVRNGAQPFDYGQSQFFLIGTWTPRIDTGLYTLALTRPFLEHHIREWVSRIANVEIRYDTSVSSLAWSPSRERVTGVNIRNGSDAQRLPSDLVIDATGRNTRLPRWLEENGFPPVPVESVGIDLGYATGRFRAPRSIRPTHPMLYIVGPPPHRTRSGVRVLVEDDVLIGALGGYHGDHPPADLHGLLEFARSLSQPDIFQVLSQSELLSPIALYRIPSSSRRYYSRMPRFPDGVLPIGDSICNFDPAFAQGMTIAAQQGEALADAVAPRSANSRLRRDYWKRIDSLVDVAWELSSEENFKYPQTTGRRPFAYSVTRRYKDRLVTCADPAVVRDLFRVLALTAPPRILIRPRIAARAFGFRLPH